MTTSRVSFDSWATLNDTIMGGTSQAGCRLTPEGLLLEGEVVAAERTYNKFASVESLPNNDAFPWRVYFEALGRPPARPCRGFLPPPATPPASAAPRPR